MLLGSLVAPKQIGRDLTESIVPPEGAELWGHDRLKGTGQSTVLLFVGLAGIMR